MGRLRAMGLLWSLGLVVPGGAFCQTEGDSGSSVKWLTEAKAGWYLGFSGEDRSPFLLGINVGFLKDRGSGNSLGGTVFVGVNDIDGFGGLEGRLRHELGTRTSLDFSVGVVPFAGKSLQTPVFVASAAFNYDWMGVGLTIQNLRDLNPVTDELSETELVVGPFVQAGGQVGGIAAIGLAALVAFAFAGLGSATG